MGRYLASIVLAAALLAMASSQASAWVCRAAGDCTTETRHEAHEAHRITAGSASAASRRSSATNPPGNKRSNTRFAKSR